MSANTSRNKAKSLNTSHHKTPKLKVFTSACTSVESTKNVSSHPPTIVMDEYGQTPDHFYLAKKSPSFYQAKRKLNLQTLDSADPENQKSNQKGMQKKGNQVKFENKATSDKHRYDTSLGQLTKRFLSFLAQANNGIINLNTACTALAVPKRRLYDITNVLEGAGLIQKTSRNNIQWMGRKLSPNHNIKKFELEKEIDILEAKENKLDELIYHMKCELYEVKEKDKEYQYVTVEDLKMLEEFQDKLTIGLKVPFGGIQAIEADNTSCDIVSYDDEIEAYLLADALSFKPISESQEVSSESVEVSADEIVDINSNNPTDYSDIAASFDDIASPLKITEPVSPDHNNHIATTWSECLEGDPIMRSAFITEDDDIAPIGRNFLLQTKDQDLEDFLPFSDLDTPIDGYSFSLDVGEGLTDLFECSRICP